MKSFRFRWVVLVSMVIAVGPAFAADLVLTTGGRVSVELLYAEAAFSNTMSITSPSVAVAITGCKLEPASGETDLFIHPGYAFRVADRLVTNFHLPKSSLLMLVSAFGGTDNVRNAYAHAIQERYRFFSYGDAMLIERRA